MGFDATLLCLSIRGISCCHCEKKVERALLGLPGVREVKFKAETDQTKWAGFRKLVLDLGNANKRFIEAKLEGRNYYTLVPRKEGE